MKRTLRLVFSFTLALSLVMPLSLIFSVEQANAAIASSQRGVSIRPRFAGDFGSTSFQQSVSNLKATGANYVTLIIPYYQSNTGSTDIAPGWNTPTDQELTSAIQYIHSQGFHVMLKPHLESNDGQWRAHINPADRETWFANYGATINHLATIAAANNVEGICIGTELISMATDSSNSTNAAHWEALIASVRSIYSGFLTYSANWGGGDFEDEKSHISFWSSLDYIGMSAYFGLNSSNEVSSLEGAWAGYDQNQIQTLSNKFNKPVLFTEIGYRSVNDAHFAPWDSNRGGSYDPTEQANDYRALFNYWNSRPYLAGMYLWEWSSDPGAGGAGDLGYSPQNKSAQGVMADLWGGGTVNPPTDSTSSPQVATTTPPVATTTPATTTPPVATTTPDVATTTATTTDSQPAIPTVTTSSGGGIAPAVYVTTGPSAGGSIVNQSLASTTSLPIIQIPIVPAVLGVASSTATTSPETSQASSTVLFARNLRMGVKGPDVQKLQQILISRGFLKKGYDTGYFGSLTQRALMRYQRVMKLPASGFFGPMTRSSIAE